MLGALLLGCLLNQRTNGAESVDSRDVLRRPAPIDVTRDLATLDGKPVGLLLPEFLCGATLERAEWSPDGARLLMVRRLPSRNTSGSPKSELLGWTARSGRTVSYWTFDPEKVEIRAIAWLGASDAVAIDTVWPSMPDPKSDLITKDPRQNRVFLLNASTGASTTLLQGRGDETVRLVASERQPRGFLRVKPIGQPARFLTFAASGVTGEIKPTEDDDRKHEDLVWFDTTGGEIMVGRLSDGKHVFDRLDPRTGLYDSSERYKPQLPTSWRRAQDSSLEWSALPGELSQNGLHGVLRLKIGETTPIRIVVATDVDGSLVADRNNREIPCLSPDGASVLYRHQGVGMIRRFVRPSPDEWTRMQAEWYHYRAMRDCAEADFAFDEGGEPGESSTSKMDLLRTHPSWDTALTRRLGDLSVRSRFVRDPLTLSLTPQLFGEAVIGTSTTPFGVARLHGSGLVDWVPKSP